jgi:hypothetical protein
VHHYLLHFYSQKRNNIKEEEEEEEGVVERLSCLTWVPMSLNRSQGVRRFRLRRKLCVICIKAAAKTFQTVHTSLQTGKAGWLGSTLRKFT